MFACHSILDIRPLLILLRICHIGRAAACNEVLTIENVFYCCIHSMLIPVIDFMGDCVFDAPKIPLPEGVGIYQNGTAIYIDCCF